MYVPLVNIKKAAHPVSYTCALGARYKSKPRPLQPTRAGITTACVEAEKTSNFAPLSIKYLHLRPCARLHVYSRKFRTARTHERSPNLPKQHAPYVHTSGAGAVVVCWGNTSEGAENVACALQRNEYKNKKRTQEECRHGVREVGRLGKVHLNGFAR